MRYPLFSEAQSRIIDESRAMKVWLGIGYGLWLLVFWLGVVAVIILFCSCGATVAIDGKNQKAIVNGGVLSTVQGFSGKANLGNGVSVAWSIMGEDAASGAVNLAGSIGGSVVGVKGFESTNKINGQNQHAATIQNAQNQKPTVLSATGADGSVTQTAVFNPALVPVVKPHK